jgi:hypothetical protein
MDIIYNTIADDIIDACTRAELNRRTIKKILLTRAEMRELKEHAGNLMEIIHQHQMPEVLKFNGVEVELIGVLCEKSTLERADKIINQMRHETISLYDIIKRFQATRIGAKTEIERVFKRLGYSRFK